ncbi:hypothetical protein [Rhizobium sp. MHM7A]|uniref:hypothetical protein n=1 Tax=Rhizobium sp. MHM7A TaxID=2583233 RepID=UPI0011074C30|nr:hypothetical protein [Rhizobium sp. MHM7A]TLX17171.1 hypothetical protein FFR93_07630 [Rhizobium sp. MHM7A]
MSAFSMVAGTNKLAGLVLHALNLEHGQVPRFRDAYLDIDEPGRPKLVILTRTGGGHRSRYIQENETLSGLVGFISDHDDPFDTTFAHWKFDVPVNAPPAVTSAIAEITEMAADPQSGLDPEILMKPMDRFKSRIEKKEWDPEPMAGQLKEIFRKAGWDMGGE